MRTSSIVLFSVYVAPQLPACVIEPNPAFEELAGSTAGDSSSGPQPSTETAVEESGGDGSEGLGSGDADASSGDAGCGSMPECECSHPCRNPIGPATLGGGVCTLSLELPIDRDAWLDEAAPGTNHGHADVLEVDSNAMVLEVSLVSWPSLDWPAGSSFVEAEFVAVASNTGDEASWHLVDEAWEESAVRWIDRPSWGEAQGTWSVRSSLVTFDVRAAFERSRPFHGIALTMGPADADGVALSSRETGLGPFLRIKAEFPVNCE